MTQEVDLGGVIYISSKKAAEKFGYTQDYIGQISRAGHIDAKKVSGLWYIQEDSLRVYKEKADQYKPEPPRRVAIPDDPDAALNFNGRDYVSAARAAQLTGYNPDYVGQLARAQKVASRQIGNRWYVDHLQLIEHKREKDAMLAAVQAGAVGLHKNPERIQRVEPLQSHTQKNLSQESADLHYTYVQQKEPLNPSLDQKEILRSEREELADEVGLYRTDIPRTAIPIRQNTDVRPVERARPVIREDIRQVEIEEEQFEHEVTITEDDPIDTSRNVHQSQAARHSDAVSFNEAPESSFPIIYTIIVPALVLMVAAGGYLYLINAPNTNSPATVQNSSSEGQSEGTTSALGDAFRSLFSKKLYYEREK